MVRNFEVKIYGIYGGCRFKSRCPYAIEQCKTEPNLEKVGNEHFCAC